MPNELFLRVADSMLALLWAWVLLRTLRTGNVGLNGGPIPARRMRPGYYWFAVFLFALMIVHFSALAIVGQAR